MGKECANPFCSFAVCRLIIGRMVCAAVLLRGCRSGHALCEIIFLHPSAWALAPAPRLRRFDSQHLPEQGLLQHKGLSRPLLVLEVVTSVIDNQTPEVTPYPKVSCVVEPFAQFVPLTLFFVVLVSLERFCFLQTVGRGSVP